MKGVDDLVDDFEEEIRWVVQKHVLLNAVKHAGKANVKAVLGKVLSERPDLKSRLKSLLELVGEVVKEVNRLSLMDQVKILEEKWPELLVKKREVRKRGLPPLPRVKYYKRVVTRFSPNPDCVLHIGNARSLVLSHDYAKLYDGDFILRFEDTDPRIKRPKLEFYHDIREDMLWLDCKWDKEFMQSDRLPTYYEYAKSLIEKGRAYVCTCEREVFKDLALKSIPCPCRLLPPEENADRWDGMLDGTFDEGEAIVRVKTDLNHPNPAVREWPALRIIDTVKSPHPRVGSRYRVWPLYNFSCAIDDHLMNITHIIRGKEHLTNEVRQRFLYHYMGWLYPETIHYGRLKITGAVLSKSEIKMGVEKGVYLGYDDPRLATLKALRRRGIDPLAIRRLMIELGVRPTDVTISWENLFAWNRKIVDRKANRYFFVANPVRLIVKGVSKGYNVKLPLHPDYPDRGSREYTLTPENGRLELLISREDVDTILRTKRFVRLMGLFNIKVEEVKAFVISKFQSATLSNARRAKMPLIHWVERGKSMPAKVLMPNGKEVSGFVESECKKLEVNDVVQFERFGFVRVDRTNGVLVTLFTHV
jgi:glutamyl-tRNA synthetase